MARNGDDDILDSVQRFYEDSIPKMENELWDMKNAAAAVASIEKAMRGKMDLRQIQDALATLNSKNVKFSAGNVILYNDNYRGVTSYNETMLKAQERKKDSQCEYPKTDKILNKWREEIKAAKRKCDEYARVLKNTDVLREKLYQLQKEFIKIPFKPLKETDKAVQVKAYNKKYNLNWETWIPKSQLTANGINDWFIKKTTEEWLNKYKKDGEWIFMDANGKVITKEESAKSREIRLAQEKEADESERRFREQWRQRQLNFEKANRERENAVAAMKRAGVKGVHTKQRTSTLMEKAQAAGLRWEDIIK